MPDVVSGIFGGLGHDRHLKLAISRYSSSAQSVTEIAFSAAFEICAELNVTSANAKVKSLHHSLLVMSLTKSALVCISFVIMGDERNV